MVVHHLREHTGAAVSRQALLADIWGYDAATGSNVVAVMIRGLRRKLGGSAAIAVGYRRRREPIGRQRRSIRHSPASRAATTPAWNSSEETVRLMGS